jgi:spermidine/putrescine transport system ATP-binding protein
MSDRVGIMSQGVLQQVDVPMEIYNNPANGFVASFVGVKNKFAGKVGAINGEFARFDTTQGPFSTKLGPGIVLGSNAILYVRPEHVVLQAKPTEGMNSIPVTVQEVAFEGNFVQVYVQDDKGVIHMAQLLNDPAVVVPTPGMRLNLSFAPERAIVLADAARSAR